MIILGQYTTCSNLKFLSSILWVHCKCLHLCWMHTMRSHRGQGWYSLQYWVISTSLTRSTATALEVQWMPAGFSNLIAAHRAPIRSSMAGIIFEVRGGPPKYNGRVLSNRWDWRLIKKQVHNLYMFRSYICAWHKITGVCYILNRKLVACQ